MAERQIIHVVAGVLRDREGKILLSERPPGKHLAGLWEFPGGKREHGETAQEALRRELHEEVGIQAGGMRRLIGFPWHYAEKSIYLDVYEVADFVGEAHGREGQALRWEFAASLQGVSMPEADVAVVTALSLPSTYAITPEPIGKDDDYLSSLRTVLQSGVKLVQLRSKLLDEKPLRRLAIAARQLVRDFGARIVLNGYADIAVSLQLDGVHLTAAQLATLTKRPVDRSFLLGASCHGANELRRAADIGVDFAVLGAIRETTSHAGEMLGWGRFADLIIDVPMPVYAIGGMRHADLPMALGFRAQGIAGISAFWK